MSRIIEIVNTLPQLLPLKPATAVQITDAEIQLRVSFADEYKDYLANFGAVMADGIELTGITKAEYRNVVSVTKKERALNPNIPNTFYVVEDTHMDGIIIWQDAQGLIYKSHPGSEPCKVAESFVDYLLSVRK